MSVLAEILQRVFAFSSFRPQQEEVCEAAFRGEDLLLVMPTGSGKSLCYQLPGLARSGTTLVISPLISLMEDQSTKLRSLKLKAEVIHSGKDRNTSRQICAQFLGGHLDFLFMAPERLSVPGFLEMLLKRKLSLVAVDEAHCISQWGHDFRPDYRLLKDRLSFFRPAPILALTATATGQVQEDIVSQLGIPHCHRFIHGFRRDNLGIEFHQIKFFQREACVEYLLRAQKQRPAIVYASSRKESEVIAQRLSSNYSAAAYHAGLSSKTREQAQRAFFDGKIEVIVATIAFGMGIDKRNIRTVIHSSLAGSVESYYQEIGRAGRDGELARAVALYAEEDTERHKYFLARDYPDLQLIKRLLILFQQGPLSLIEAWGGARLFMKGEEFQSSLNQLKTHGGIREDGRGSFRWADPTWELRYRAQRLNKEKRLKDLLWLVNSLGCRMLNLLRYFGDKNDSGKACGLCDFCAPEKVLLRI